ncbi:MAG: tetratricopeptide repeat protein [Chitinivibrionales bacterium]|nr:tetratricopeptide repeat protein [Chitinivibrionales bacterium]
MIADSTPSTITAASEVSPYVYLVRHDRLFYPAIFLVWVLLLWVIYHNYPYMQPSVVSSETSAAPLRGLQIIQKSIGELKNALLTEKNSTQLMHVNHNLGIEYYDLYKLTNNIRHLDSARIFFTTSLQSSPPIARFYYNMGRTYTEYRDHGRAKSFYEKALSYDPNHILALHNLALLNYFELHRLADAKSYMLRVLAINPNLPVSNFILGEISTDEKDFTNARMFYERELYIDTTNMVRLRQLPISESSIGYSVGMSHLRLAMLFSTRFIDRDRAQSNLYAYLRMEPDSANRANAIAELKKYWVMQ